MSLSQTEKECLKSVLKILRMEQSDSSLVEFHSLGATTEKRAAMLML